MPFTPPAFYPIVNVRGDAADEIGRARLLARRLASAGVELLQLRAKDLASGAFTELAAELVVDLHARQCRLIVNDRVDVAMAAGAAGVHLGDTDLPVATARSLLGPGAVVGYSTHSLDDVSSAPREASYLGFGPVFESPTKAGVRAARGVELLSAACRAATLPVVAIGGVTLARAAEVWRAGAQSAAVISEIEGASDVEALARAWLSQAARR